MKGWSFWNKALTDFSYLLECKGQRPYSCAGLGFEAIVNELDTLQDFRQELYSLNSRSYWRLTLLRHLADSTQLLSDVKQSLSVEIESQPLFF